MYWQGMYRHAFVSLVDRMNDRDFMAAVMRMGQEEKESLMISESRRMRTYLVLWPHPKFLDYRELAVEGLFYTGMCHVFHRH